MENRTSIDPLETRIKELCERYDQSNGWQERTAIFQELLLMGKQALPMLGRFAATDSQNVQFLVARLLGELRDEGSMPVLERLMLSNDADVRKVAGRAIVKIGAPCFDLLFRLRDAEPRAEVRRDIADAIIDLSMRKESMEKLEAISSKQTREEIEWKVGLMMLIAGKQKYDMILTVGKNKPVAIAKRQSSR